MVVPCVPRSSTLKATRIRLKELTSDVEQGRSSKKVFIVVGISSDVLGQASLASPEILLHVSCVHHARTKIEFMKVPHFQITCEIQRIDGEKTFFLL